jgi:hypothetical protein
MSSDDPNIQAALDAAQKSIRDAAADAVDPAAAAIKALSRAALPSERPALLQALGVLLQSRVPLLAAFDKALRQAVDDELSPKDEDPAFRDPTDWKAVGLVDEDQFEERLAFERVGQFIGHECEAELRDLSAYTGEMFDIGWADPARNPLRGQVIGAALDQAIESVAQGSESRRVLVKELGQALAKTLPGSYRAIIDDFAARGFRQVDLTVRPSPSPVGGSGGGYVPGGGGYGPGGAGYGGGAGTGGGYGGAGFGAGGATGMNAAASPGVEVMRELWEKSMMGRMPMGPGSGAGADVVRAWEASIANPQAGGFPGAPGGEGMPSSAAMFERLMQGALAGAPWSGAAAPQPGGLALPTGGGGGNGVSDADLMRLLRRLNESVPAEPVDAAGAVPRPVRSGAEPTFFGTPFSTTGGGAGQSIFGGSLATNLIRAHHDELVQASPGELDHMVIEVVASLFDQILSDARVPPQIAREIARLQMPVLRVALRDPSFFSSRKHPVRRFINRISTLASSFGEFESGPGKELLVRVNALVTEIVGGDFDQVPLYVRKLGELEQFIAASSRAEFESSPAAATLQAKEAEWQTAQRFSGRLHEAYEHLPIPDYLKAFLADVWSQVIVAAARGGEADPAREKRFRRAAYHLVASIQPKRSIEQRTQFLAGLRGLTSTLDEGLALIGWPEDEHDAFFGKLIADHSGSLKAAPGSELDHNMLMRQLDVAARTPLPDAGEAGAAALGGPSGPAFEPRFSASEAQRVGLVDDAAVDWSSPASLPAASEPAAAPTDAPQAQAAAAPLDLDLATRPAPLDELPPARPAAVASALVAAKAEAAVKAAAAAKADPDAFPMIEFEPEVAAPPALPAAPVAVAPAEPEEPTEGSQLRHHLQIGASYRLHLKDQWEKVRLTHMNASRTFFLFTHGAEDRGTISMTVRMLGRLCDTGRLKAFEDKQLLDRATERMRAPASAPGAVPAVRKPELSSA